MISLKFKLVLKFVFRHVIVWTHWPRKTKSTGITLPQPTQMSMKQPICLHLVKQPSTTSSNTCHISESHSSAQSDSNTKSYRWMAWKPKDTAKIDHIWWLARFIFSQNVLVVDAILKLKCCTTFNHIGNMPHKLS